MDLWDRLAVHAEEHAPKWTIWTTNTDNTKIKQLSPRQVPANFLCRFGKSRDDFLDLGGIKVDCECSRLGLIEEKVTNVHDNPPHGGGVSSNKSGVDGDMDSSIPLNIHNVEHFVQRVDRILHDASRSSGRLGIEQKDGQRVNVASTLSVAAVSP